MRKRTAIFPAALMAVILLPALCSCSLFKKKQIKESAEQFIYAIENGDASDILRTTDGLERDFRASFKEQLEISKYGIEDQVYLYHMKDSISAEIDEDSIEINDDIATCTINFTVADYESLENSICADEQTLASAVDECSKISIPVSVEFTRIEKEWYVTNFADGVYPSLYAFLDYRPPIGRTTLVAAASQVAEAVVSDKPESAYNLSTPYDESGTILMQDYVEDLFSVSDTVTDEEIAFQAAVLSTMSYEIDESSLQLSGSDGSVDIKITMADYAALSGKSFKKTSDITAAVEACDTVTFTYTCTMKRTDFCWSITNLTSEEFSAFLNYKRFSISLNNIDGTYESRVDITDKFTAYVSKEFGIKLPDDLEGKIYITSSLILDNGAYRVTIDDEAFKANVKKYVEANIDKIIMNMLGTTSTSNLDFLAKIAGYADYNDMKTQILSQVTNTLETVNTSVLESSGSFTVSNDTITLKSSSDTMKGTIDNYGVITVTSPVNDPDAKKLLGSDTITLAFNKVQ